MGGIRIRGEFMNLSSFGVSNPPLIRGRGAHIWASSDRFTLLFLVLSFVFLYLLFLFLFVFCGFFLFNLMPSSFCSVFIYFGKFQYQIYWQKRKKGNKKGSKFFACYEGQGTKAHVRV